MKGTVGTYQSQRSISNPPLPIGRFASGFAFTCFAIKNNFPDYGPVRVHDQCQLCVPLPAPTASQWVSGSIYTWRATKLSQSFSISARKKMFLRTVWLRKCQSREALLWYVSPTYTLPLNCIGGRMDFGDCCPCICRDSGICSNTERAETHVE